MGNYFSKPGPSEKTLSDLPDLPILKISKYLSAKDFLALSHTSRRIYFILESDCAIWRKISKNENIQVCSTIRESAKILVENEIFHNLDKAVFILHLSTRQNWTSAESYSNVSVLPGRFHSRFCDSQIRCASQELHMVAISATSYSKTRKLIQLVDQKTLINREIDLNKVLPLANLEYMEDVFICGPRLIVCSRDIIGLDIEHDTVTVLWNIEKNNASTFAASLNFFTMVIMDPIFGMGSPVTLGECLT